MTLELLTFSMRATPPKAGVDWFKIVEAKKASEPTKVYIYDEIGMWGTSAKDFAALLSEIDTPEIELHLNSPGGSVFDGLAIHATLKSHKAKVTGVVDGMAASAASFILQAADVRQSTRNAQVMIHDAKAYAGGNAAQMRQAANLLDRVSDNIADIYAVRSGQGSITSWRDIMRSGDEWYGGNEALDAGLVDEVIDNPAEDQPAEAASNSWSVEDVEAFLKTPPEKLAAANQVAITNRVEEALMTGADPQKQNPPAPAQPPAPQAQGVPAPPAAPAPAAPAPAAPAPVAPARVASTETFMVNGVEMTDYAAVRSHIASLETFQKETIEGGRKAFVAKLVKDGKILANEETVTTTENFALSLTNEGFSQWQGIMDATPAQTIFSAQGNGTGNSTEPQNGGEKVAADKAQRIADLQGIVDSHKAAGLSQEEIENKPSYKELQTLTAKA